MHLHKLHIKRFRSCEDAVVTLHPDLTLLAGENSSGKTNILDAIRLLTTPTDDRRTRFAEQGDVRRGAGDFELEAVYSELDRYQAGYFYTALANAQAREAIFGLGYTPPAAGARRGEVSTWVGSRRAADPEPRARKLIRHVHLPALRDASRELASGGSNRVQLLLEGRAEAGEVADFERRARDALKELSGHPLVERSVGQVRDRLGHLTRGVREHQATLGFAEPLMRSLARDMRFRLGIADAELAELSESGLGYANLLFLATVVAELEAARDAELTLFLVEEPEAHLHPQLQAVTLDYLREHAVASGKSASPDAAESRVPGAHAGRIQVVVTTHSPNMSSGVSLAHAVVTRLAPHNDAPASSRRGLATQTIAIRKLGLAKEDVAKIDRYLDVTRAALLFTPRVLLVEGIAESLLLPAFARRHFAKEPGKLSLFRGCSVVAVDGVDFSPYVQLLLSPDAVGGARMVDRVVVLTDEDQDDAGQTRADALKELAKRLGAEAALSAVVTPLTLEAALFESSSADRMKEVFLTIHPRSGEKWDRYLLDASHGSSAQRFLALMKSSQTRKGRFAQAFAEGVDLNSTTAVPTAIVAALDALVSPSVDLAVVSPSVDTPAP